MIQGNLQFKTEEIYLAHATKAHDPMLSSIEYYIIETFGMLVTCSYREKRHPNDLHGTLPVRAKDIRSWQYKRPEEIVKTINTLWIYDELRPNKKVALYHNTGEGAHIHLQVHPNTRKRV